MNKENLTVIEIRLKFLRDLKGLTQSELADKLHISRSVINCWENGYANISLKQLVKVAYFYQVPVDYIFGLTTKFNRDNYQFKSTLNLKELGKKIRILRKIESLTQDEFAQKIKTKASNISYYESGKMAISSADLKDICNTFGYSADWCLGNIEECLKREPKITIPEKEIKTYIKI